MGLLERDRELDTLGAAFVAARTGTGSGIAVSGEPGSGKTALVAAASARTPGLRVLRAGCDPLATPRPLGPFRDLSGPLFGAGAETVIPTDEHATDAAARGLTAAVGERAFGALHAQPTVLVVEDVHWIDAASVEVLRFLLRRIEAVPCVLLITYRADDIGPQHPARPLLGDLAALDHVVDLRLGPLSVAAVAELVADGQDADLVHRRTGGNPFFVAEIVKDPDRPLPATVRDAVLARTAGVAPDDFEVLQIAAAAPNRLDDRVLPALGVDLPTLRRLYETGLLVRDPRGLVFRHELARLAVESTIPVGGSARLHRRLLDALEGLAPRDPAVLTHHAVAAADSVRPPRYARAAAREAARAGSHTEAAAFLQIALTHLSTDEPADRARMHARLAYEQYMTSRLSAAVSSMEQAFLLWERSGDREGLSAAYTSCAVYEYYNARRSRAEQHAARAVELAGDAASDVAYGSARAIQGYLAYQRSEAVGAATGDGLRAAERAGDRPLLLRSRLIRAASDLADGDAAARDRCLEITQQARAGGLDELASTGYSNVSYLDVEQGRFGAAEAVLEDSLPYAVERDIPICRHWQTAVRSRLRFREGRWDAALEDASAALGEIAMPMATFWPLVVRAQVGLRRDGSGAADAEAAWRIATDLGEPLRIVPALAALAERNWLTGAEDPRITVASEQLAGWATISALRWSLGDLVVWMHRLGHGVAPVDRLPEPHRLELAGRNAEAAAWWHRAGAAYEAAMAYSTAGDGAAGLALRLKGLEALDLLGATAIADRLRLDLRRSGVDQLPARPRGSTRANPSGLTNRQLEVARLVARGLTNGEISARLFISPRTADHHVSAVLAKLGMPSRRSVVLAAGDLGLR